MSDRSRISSLGPSEPKLSRLPSVNFLLILLIFSGTGAALWHGWIGGRFAVFVFVIAGWVVSLCLHEFGHAVVAYRGGDRAVASSGYLTLDPMRYTDVGLSVIFPLLIILVGGFGLPGGAVFINARRLRGRGWAAAVAAAGPFANLLCLAGLAALYQALPPSDVPTDIGAGIGVLAFFQATAIILNLFPFPGLDGFNILRPFLSPQAAAKADTIGAAAFLLLFLLLWLTPVGGSLIKVGVDVTSAFGIPLESVAVGFGMVRLF